MSFSLCNFMSRLKSLTITLSVRSMSSWSAAREEGVRQVRELDGREGRVESLLPFGLTSHQQHVSISHLLSALAKYQPWLQSCWRSPSLQSAPARSLCGSSYQKILQIIKLHFRKIGILLWLVLKRFSVKRTSDPFKTLSYVCVMEWGVCAVSTQASC